MKNCVSRFHIFRVRSPDEVRRTSSLMGLELSSFVDQDENSTHSECQMLVFIKNVVSLIGKYFVNEIFSNQDGYRPFRNKLAGYLVSKPYVFAVVNMYLVYLLLINFITLTFDFIQLCHQTCTRPYLLMHNSILRCFFQKWTISAE